MIHKAWQHGNVSKRVGNAGRVAAVTQTVPAGGYSGCARVGKRLKAMEGG